MNKMLLLSLSLLMVTSPALAADKKACATEQVIAKVDGMVCDFCAQGLIKTFMKEDPVEKVDIDLTTKEVRISLKDGQTLADSVVTQRVDYAGYKVTSIEHSCKKS